MTKIFAQVKHAVAKHARIQNCQFSGQASRSANSSCGLDTKKNKLDENKRGNKYPFGLEEFIEMDEKDEQALLDGLDNALPVVMSLPIASRYLFAPVVWVKNRDRQDAQDLQARLATIGEHFSQFNEFELKRIYGKTEVRWIYVFRKQYNAFFLWMRTQAPSFERPFVTLPALQAELIISFNVDDLATQALLRSIVTSRAILLHFDEVPAWVTQLPPLQSGQRRFSDYDTKGKILIQSSFPLAFFPEVVAKMGLQLEQWLAYTS